MALHIRADGRLVVRAPRFAADNLVYRFIRENSLWIERTRRRIFERRRLAEEWRAQFPQSDAHYKEQAAELFSQRCAFYAARMGVSYKKIALTDASSRWGSCSPKGILRFHWKLVTAPPEVADYVVVHELAHLKELNHSKRFWDLVQKAAPDFRSAKKWLRDHPL